MSKYQGVKTLEVLEGADNYNRWIADSIKPFIASPALEVGAGTGNISSYFTHLNSITLTDSDKDLVKVLREKFGKLRTVKTRILDITNPKGEKGAYSTIYSVNVFEHIKTDDASLKNVNLLLKRGRIVMLVPAKMFAMTNLDKELGHYRRYEKAELSKKLTAAGFELEKIQFFNILGLLSWIVRDKVSKDDTHLKPYQVKMFDSIVPILKRIEGLVNPPIGISLIAVARKK